MEIFLEGMVILNSILVWTLLVHRPENIFTLANFTGNLSITPLFMGYQKMLGLLRDGCAEAAKMEFERILPIQAQILDCIKQ